MIGTVTISLDGGTISSWWYYHVIKLLHLSSDYKILLIFYGQELKF